MWQKDEFVTKSDQYSREFILKLIFILGPHIDDKKPVSSKDFSELVEQARESRLNVDDVKTQKWDDLRMTLNWWWKKCNSHGTEKNQKKNRERYEDFRTEATSYWRSQLKNNS